MYVIKNVETDLFVHAINLIGVRYAAVHWTPLIDDAIQLENEEEANSVITFIGDVIDWELEQVLIYICE